MKKALLPVVAIVAVVAIIFFIMNGKEQKLSDSLKIIYPFENALFPADITAPTFEWNEENEDIKKWQISVEVEGRFLFENIEINEPKWQPNPADWKSIIDIATGKQVLVKVSGTNRKSVSSDQIAIEISPDKVETPIFYRAVPLPFKFARDNLKNVRWHLGEISNENPPHAVLDNIPVCANCHSFTPNGKTIAMDVDARDDKGAYSISSIDKEILFAKDSIIHWSDQQDGKFTYGLLSQISPDGRYVVSTLNDGEIFVDRDDLAYSQLFFPFKGILVVYDRFKKEYFELKGANDTLWVQSNPTWSPDGEFIYFARARAKQYNESHIHNGSVPKAEDIPEYKIFEGNYTRRDSLIKFDIYKIPFNNGKGGIATPVPGASQNGLSNYFPKISPDGKWLVFTQAESFMLLQKDSKLNILPVEGGTPRQMTCNTDNMNSWHSFSPNSKWMVFSTKARGPYTQLFLTHINTDGTDSRPVHLEKFSFDKFANNIPEFVNIEYDPEMRINPTFLAENDFIVRIGEIKQKQGDLDGAFESFNKAVIKFPNESEPYYKRGNIYFLKDELALAIEDFTEALQIEKLPNYYIYRGLSYLKQNNYEKVISDLTAAIKLDNTLFTPFAYLGVAYIRTNEYRKAIEALENANELFDLDELTNYYLGVARYSVEDWKLADQAFTRALELNIQNSASNQINFYRAKARLELKNIDGALEDLNAAVIVTPNNAEIYLLLGKTQLEIGLKNEAKRNLEKAKQLGSADADKFLNASL